MNEANVLQECRLAASECGAVTHRNNRGAYKDKNGRFVRYGVGEPGGSDLIGWTKDGKFLAIECKPPGWKPSGNAETERYYAQANFIKQVNAAGGVAGFAHGKDDVYRLLGNDSKIGANRA